MKVNRYGARQKVEENSHVGSTGTVCACDMMLKNLPAFKSFCCSQVCLRF